MVTSSTFHIIRPVPSRQAGFTLVEILVGLVIGMLATVVVMQVFSVFETQKRTTTGNADAMTNGNIALFNISREIAQAGYAILPTTAPAVLSPYSCTAVAVSGVEDLSPSAHTYFSPVAISDVGASDTITVRYGDSSRGGVPSVITGTGLGNISIANSLACAVNDTSLVINGTSCAISKVTAIVPAAASQIPATITLDNFKYVASGASLACLGNFHQVTYSVSKGNLVRSDLAVSATPDNVVEGIVNIQAQYGVSSGVSATGFSSLNNPDFNRIVSWVDATGATWGANNITLNNRNRIKAVRLAIVARTDKKELKDAAGCTTTQACNAATNTGLCAWPNSASSTAPAIDLSADPDWQCYHYRVFNVVVPLRNVMWQKDGVVLFFTLVALLVMSLAMVALIRSVDTSAMIAGNLANKQSATITADRGIEAAMSWLAAQNTNMNAASISVLNNPIHVFNLDNAAVGYYSSLNPNLSLTRTVFPFITWTNAVDSACLPTDGNGNTVCYVIQRMCPNANTTVQAQIAPCLVGHTSDALNDQSVTYSDQQCKGPGCIPPGYIPQLRITSRTTGPRNTLSYVQAYVY